MTLHPQSTQPITKNKQEWHGKENLNIMEEETI